MVDQGKNIIVFGMPSKSYSWGSLDYRWPNMAWPDELKQDLTETIADFHHNPPHDLYWYKAECTPNAAMVTRCIGGLPGAAVFRRADEKLEFLEDLAAAANHRILEVLHETPVLPFWVLSTDYVQNDVIDRILDINRRAPLAVAPLDLSMATEQEMSVYTGSIMNASVFSSETPLHRASRTIRVCETGL